MSGYTGGLRRFLFGLLVVVECGWFSGCFQFVQVDPVAAPEGARVRAELTTEGSSRVAEALGEEEESRIEGRVVEVSPDGGILLEVVGESRATPVGVSARPLFSRVSLPGEDFTNFELRQLNRNRTAFLVGGAVAVAAVIVTAAFDIAGGNDADDDGPDVDQILIPFFSFRIGG